MAPTPRPLLRLPAARRSLQKENKEVLEEARRRAAHEAEQRMALQEKFSAAINVGAAGCAAAARPARAGSRCLSPLAAVHWHRVLTQPLRAQDVNAKMDQQAGERAKQLAENDALRDKLAAFIGQYELSEKHHAQQLHTKVRVRGAAGPPGRPRAAAPHRWARRGGALPLGRWARRGALVYGGARRAHRLSSPGRLLRP
jgi:hypothetical protein